MIHRYTYILRDLTNIYKPESYLNFVVDVEPLRVMVHPSHHDDENDAI